MHISLYNLHIVVKLRRQYTGITGKPAFSCILRGGFLCDRATRYQNQNQEFFRYFEDRTGDPFFYGPGDAKIRNFLKRLKQSVLEPNNERSGMPLLQLPTEVGFDHDYPIEAS